MSDRKPLITVAPNPYLQSDPDHLPGGSNADNADTVMGGVMKMHFFPVDCLDTVSATMVREAARAALVPEPLVGCCALALLSAALGAGLEVISSAERRTRGNLYLLSIAESGTGKGTAFSVMAEPLLRLEREHVEDWKYDVLPDLMAKYAMAEQRLKALKKNCRKPKGSEDQGNMQQEMKSVEQELAGLRPQMEQPCWTVADCTREALEGLLCTAKNECVASLSPEARGAMDVMAGRYREGMSDESIYLSCYTGEPAKIHRKTSRPVILNRPCLTILWMMQPDKLREVMKKPNLADSGFFPRFLICDTKAAPQQEPPNRPTISEETAEAWSDLLETLVQHFHNAGATLTITPSLEASEVLRAYYNEIVPERSPGGKYHDVGSFAARWAEQAWRLSVVLHAAQHGAEAPRVPLSEDTAQRAVTLARWFATEQLSILEGGRQLRSLDRLQKLVAALRGYPNHTATLRDLQRRNALHRSEVEAAAREFPEEVALEKIRHGNHGQPSELARLVRC